MVTMQLASFMVKMSRLFLKTQDVKWAFHHLTVMYHQIIHLNNTCNNYTL